ncbi:OACYL [Cordylochernes scorpioides]|uniref:OACYL n=1 Tax=Cordylochernes scorpioides TaxID=51811 RepID=A0ABY6LAT0_9ARAC|nr:OACYL [Cordylochernes scorpioides]
MLYGGVKSLGYLTECLRAPAPYRPQYCLLEVAVNTTPPSVPAALWSMLKKFPAKLATCLPAVCSPETIREALQNGKCFPHLARPADDGSCPATSVQHWSANVTLTSCTDGQDDILRDPAALVVMTLLLLVVLLVVVGTLRERLRGSSMLGHSGSAERLVLPAPGGEKAPRRVPMLQGSDAGCTEPSRLDRALCAFSIYSNGRKLLSTNSSGDSIDIIHGIRFLSMAWIIVGHSFSFAMTWLTFSKFLKPSYISRAILYKFNLTHKRSKNITIIFSTLYRNLEMGCFQSEKFMEVIEATMRQQ